MNFFVKCWGILRIYCNEIFLDYIAESKWGIMQDYCDFWSDITKSDSTRQPPAEFIENWTALCTVWQPEMAGHNQALEERDFAIQTARKVRAEIERELRLLATEPDAEGDCATRKGDLQTAISDLTKWQEKWRAQRDAEQVRLHVKMRQVRVRLHALKFNRCRPGYGMRMTQAEWAMHDKSMEFAQRSAFEDAMKWHIENEIKMHRDSIKVIDATRGVLYFANLDEMCEKNNKTGALLENARLKITKTLNARREIMRRIPRNVFIDESWETWWRETVLIPLAQKLQRLQRQEREELEQRELGTHPGSDATLERDSQPSRPGIQNPDWNSTMARIALAIIAAVAIRFAFRRGRLHPLHAAIAATCALATLAATLYPLQAQ